MEKITIERVNTPLLKKIIPLIGAYQKFYGENPDDSRNLKFFGDLIENEQICVQFAALDGNLNPMGFVTLYFIPSSVQAKTNCILNDLFTIPDSRGSGVGKTLIDHCRDFANQRGFGFIEWMTQKSNTKAQRLYDHLKASKTEWYSYALSTKERESAGDVTI